MTCRPWKVLGFDIGGVRIANPLVLAPMAGVCDAPFRRICKEMGCGLVYTEMISAMALVYDNRRTLEMLRIFDDERPVAVHGRTRADGYSGAADWSVVARVARAVPVPVLGNGDVDSPEAAARMLDETGCAAVMVGRGALGNPWIFGRALRFITTGQLLAEPSAGQRIALAMRHLADVAAFKGDETAASQMRKHLAWYIRGLRGSARVREAIMAAPTVSALESVLREYLLVLDAGQC